MPPLVSLDRRKQKRRETTRSRDSELRFRARSTRRSNFVDFVRRGSCAFGQGGQLLRRVALRPIRSTHLVNHGGKE
jgi:hypothetical protein